jgi:membrane-bound serine protease (ClpP class)
MFLWLMVFFVSGIVLIISEFFLPGGILGVIGSMLVIISGILGVYSYPEYALFIIIGETLAVGAGIVLGFVILTRTRAAKLLTLDHAQTQNAGYVSAASDLTLLNQKGIVLTALRPSGTIKVGDKRIDAVSDGIFINEGARVIVVEVHGSRVLVEPIATE